MPLRRARAVGGRPSGYSFGVYRLNVSLAQLVQALAIAGVGLAIMFVPLALVWSIDRGFGPDILLSWRAAVDAWLLGHGVTLDAQLPEAVAARLGAEEALRPFSVTLWPLGIGLLTFVLSYRSGLALESAASGMAADHVERVEGFGGTPRPHSIFTQVLLWGVIGSTLTTAVVGFVLALTAQHETVSPSLVQAAYMPALVSLIGHVTAILWRHRTLIADFVTERLTIPAEWAMPIRAGLHVGVVTIVALVALGSAATGLTLFTHFDRMVAISEASSPTVLGALVMFLAQLALLPNAVVWAISWMIGAPVQLGTGSTLSPFEASLGPLPGIPAFGAIPSTIEPWFLALVVLTAVVVVALGMMAARRFMPEHDEWWQPLVAAVSATVLAATALVVVTVLSSGAIGPGRMQELGPDIGAVAAIAFGGLALAMSAAFYGSKGVDYVIGRDAEGGLFDSDPDDDGDADDAAAADDAVEVEAEPADPDHTETEQLDDAVAETEPDRDAAPRSEP